MFSSGSQIFMRLRLASLAQGVVETATSNMDPFLAQWAVPEHGRIDRRHRMDAL